jgi:hypothetical protein
VGPDVGSHCGASPDLLGLALEAIGDLGLPTLHPYRDQAPDAGGRVASPIVLSAVGDLTTDLGDGLPRPDGADEHPGAGADRLRREVGQLVEQGKRSMAIATASRVAESTRTAAGDHHPQFAVDLMVLANLLWEHGDLDQAGELHLRAEAIFREALGEGDPMHALCLYDSARLREFRGDGEEAKGLYVRAAPVAISALGQGHPICRHILDRMLVLSGSLDPLSPTHGVICAGA